MQKMLMQLSGWNEEKRKVDRIICPYCYQFHSNDELEGNICPKMIPFVKGIQDKQSFKCTDCFGEGSFEKIIETKVYQTNKKYQQRLQAWKQNGEINQKPQRKLLKEEKLEQVIYCKKCKGKGKIYKACSKRSNKPWQSSLQVNESWVEQKMKGEPCQEGFKCIICMEDSEVTSLSLTLNCSHSFHLKCIYKWLKTNGRCPICRNVDPFININLVPPQIKQDQQSVVVRVQRNNRQIAQEIQRRSYFNGGVNEQNSRIFNFGFGQHYSQEESW